ncbi:hypothetical protein ARALYDRAFT_901879 [Arabidopsis lyrata subsp. lyrata]|uniref:Uncharacterized protein n=1 Tax=Arabidopsis lyrata subsp. lyrata TaxID=81972 RepID=D7LKN6_ARALL|nr:uncharacterized protein LOC9317101 [Arabidopsis lyrata subsp. lyrata]EFH55464.1 hypothetical protein ARALYDRAFT_901879 [Arabidopsis lyrata subsp. lyrata]|eukprot:XP_002879205.1 uncharacterized protein LOC9317101 [Arabidopsis lyrata subsp. lyrata]
MSATTTPSLSLSNFTPRFQHPVKTHHISPLSWSVSRRKILSSRVLRVHKEKTQLWRVSATPEEISQEIVSSDSSSEAIVSSGGQDGVALIIQVLLFVAFLALTVLTIGVVYIGVTEFLGKREREKFEKDEAAKKSKKGGKKKAMRAKAGPRGFGQKIEDDDIDIDLE